MAILLGAQNIEQTKLLHYSSLKAMVEHVIKHPNNQRAAIREMASVGNREDILRFNADMVGASKQSDFYYDPHTKHYTGQLKILDTWCPGVRLADKGINMDYIHTRDGYPVYFDTTDNFYDLRERFIKNINHFRWLVGICPEKTISIIIDRGIFSAKVFSDVIKRPNLHIITWEKGYNHDKWDSARPSATGHIEKTRNHRNDKKLVNYQYQDGTWDKDPGMRRIIVRVMDKKWKVLIEVSILTDDKDRRAEEVIELMLKRWVQENDFKYLIKHFGINQITTYAFVDYKDLRDKIEDKLYTSGRYKELTKEIQKVRAKLKTALLRQYDFSQKHPGPEKKLPKRENTRKTKIWGEVAALDKELQRYIKLRKGLGGKTSKIEELIKTDYKKLDTDTKSFVDAIKILARNMFYLSLQPFKEEYDNYRDDHQLFRNLTRSAGKFQLDGENVVVTLMPTMEYPRKTKTIFVKILEQINKTQPTFPNGSNERLILKLVD